jgi:hypothetical protein
MKKSLLTLLFVGLMLVSSMAYAEGDVTISIPFNDKGCIPLDTTFVMQVSFDNSNTLTTGVSIPFSIYDGNTPTNAVSISHIADGSAISAQFPFGVSLNDQSIFTYNGWGGFWTLINMFYGNNWDATLPDTINFTGLAIPPAGWPASSGMTMYFGFNLQVHDAINQFCIDSIDHEDDTYDWLLDVPFSFGGPYCFCTGDAGTAVNYDNNSVLPKEFELYQNYPNPFNMSTTIEFAVPYKSDVNITIFNVLGQRVQSFDYENMEAGYHSAVWNGTSDNGSEVASGLYFYKIEADNFQNTKKLMLLK